MYRDILLFIHVTGVVVWVGGMFFAYFCLRPAAGKVLEPPRRVALWVETFRPFFRYVAVAVAAIVASGFVMIAEVGFGNAPRGWHFMMLFGLAMAAVFVYVYGALYPRLRAARSEESWPAAGAVLDSIRRLVAVNLVLAVCAVVSALSAR